MKTPVKILLLEDNELDQKILQKVIVQSGLDTSINIVDDEKDYTDSLKSFVPDVVLADFVIPGFGGMEALTILKRESPATPFIFVTGQLSEETAIDCLNYGAWDYILKSRIKRLPVAINSALRLRDEKNEKERINGEIRTSEMRFRSMAANINDGILIFENETLTFINERAKTLLRFESAEFENLKMGDLVPADYIDLSGKLKMDKSLELACPAEFEKYYPNENDFDLCLLFKCAAGKNGGQHSAIYFTISDITHQRLDQREERLKLKFTSHLIEARNLDDLFNTFTVALEKYLKVKNFAIAILEEEKDIIRVVYIKDEKDTPAYFPAGKTFASQVIKNQELVFLQEADILQMVSQKLVEYVGARAKVWMGVPFETTRYKGLVVIQDYENQELISKNDIGLLKFIADQIGKQLERKYFIEDIKASEFKFRELFENMSSGAAILSPNDSGKEFILKDLNNSALRIFENVAKTNGELVRHAFPDCRDPFVFKMFEKVYQTGISEYLPVKAYNIFDQQYWLDFYIYKLTKGEIVVVFDDHSERIRAQELISENERRYRVLSELTFEGILIHDKGIVIDCNLSFARMFGYERDALIGINFIGKLIDESSREQIENFVLNDVSELYELIGIMNNGERFPLEVEAKSATIKGKAVRVVAMRDISQRKKALEEIRLTEEKFNKISNSAQDAIVLMDHEGKISYWNKAAGHIFQFTENEILGKNLHDILAPLKYHAAYNAGFEKFLRFGQGGAVGKTVELEGIKKNGEIIPVELSLSSINMRGKWNALGIIRDITVRKQYETEILSAKKQAEEMNRLKTNFLSTMSHELRTPLNGILGFAEILKTSLNDPEMCEFADIILKSSMRLLNTFNLIIDLSVIEANELKVKKKPEDLVQLIEMIQEPHKAEASAKGLFLDVVSNVRQCIVNIDQILFSQAINNLLNNAIKYTQHGGVTLTLDEVSKNGSTYYSVSVADTGIGISAKNVTMIYDAFRQASEGYNRAFEGSGLGLHITRRYVEMLGGIIELESEPGEGSVFTIFIPKYAEESWQLESSPTVNKDQGETGKPEGKLFSILYVEDDPDHREFVRIFLKGLYDLHTATNGPESIMMAKEKLYDIILMDINLGPKMNGLDAVKEIRKLPGYKNIPIAAITANAMVAQKNEFLSEGCSHYISKPFNKHKLLGFLSSMTDSRS